jgi:hypothetical protein
MRSKRALRRYAGPIAVVMVAAAGIFAAVALAGATSTTDNAGYVDGTYTTQNCVNGSNGVNCNIYLDKRDVWTSGLPSAASLTTGDYFLAVLAPGGQHDPNDGEPGNLSTSDTWAARSFHVDSGGTISALGSTTHVIDSGKIQLVPYADTPNPGGVYILAICTVPASPSSGDVNGLGAPGVDPHVCKYDAFKVSLNDTTPPALDLGVSKRAGTALTTTHHWAIDKSVDACEVTATNTAGCSIAGTTKTLNYTVTVTKDPAADPATDSAWAVTGTITVDNSNSFSITGVKVSDDINDANDYDSCSVSAGSDVANNSYAASGATIPESTSVTYPYSCSYSHSPSATSQTNTATATWDAQNGLPHTSATGTATVDWNAATITSVHDSVTVSDLLTSTNPATLPSGFVVGSPVGDSVSGSISVTTTFHYSRTLTVPHDCLTVNNTATFADGTYTKSDSVSAKVCRTAARTGALTIGFWQNKNGQGIISGQAKTGTCPSTTWLLAYAPFQDLSSSATCSAVATYVYNVIKAANAGGTSMNPMLKAQMLATALDVYFSSSALGGNKINAPNPIGGLTIDLQNICKMIDGSGGTATCSGVYQDASSAFGGAASLTVLQMLAYAASQSNAGGSTWYGNVKATQELAKNAFDAINNQVAFTI